MVGTEVEHGCEIHGNWYIVQSRAGHGIACFEDGIEVVRIPVVSYESVYCKPNVGLGGVSLGKGSLGIGGREERGWENDGLKNAG